MAEPTIIFRKLTEGPSLWSDGLNVPASELAVERWQVDFYDDEAPFPVGVAWVVGSSGEKARFFIEHILVNDAHRRHGVASALVIACQRRWSGIRLLGDSTPGGRALLRSFQPPVRAKDVFDDRFIQKALEEGKTMEDLDAAAQRTQDAFDFMDFEDAQGEGEEWKRGE